MFWSWTVAFVLLCASTASEEPDTGQREVIDPDPMLQRPLELWEMEEPDMGQREVIDPDPMLQRPLELWEMEGLLENLQTQGTSDYDRLFERGERAESDMTNKEDFLHPDIQHKPRAGPRSFASTGPSVLFPPGQPSPDNLHAICSHSNRRPRYPENYFPTSGFGHLHRQGETINQLESWYGTCCHGNGTQQLQEGMLCCVKQAWEQSLFTYCETESGIKTFQPHCCMKKDKDRLTCFHKEAPNPTYMPITKMEGSSSKPEPGFTFDPNACLMSQPGPRGTREDNPRKTPKAALRHADISFPPGRPTSQNIGSICRHLYRRPLYTLQCLPRTGYGWLARQSRVLNRLERGFKLCCEGPEDVLPCAEGKWRELLDGFCDTEPKGRTHNSPCCGVEEGEQRYTCFESRASHPTYAAPQASTLAHVIKKRYPITLPVESLGPCCSLPAEQRTSCIEKTFAEHAVGDMYRVSHAFSQKCCLLSSEDQKDCYFGLTRKKRNRATKSTRPRKCPLY